MTEERLNNCLLVHGYKEIADELDPEAISRRVAGDGHKGHVHPPKILTLGPKFLSFT